MNKLKITLIIIISILIFDAILCAEVFANESENNFTNLVVFVKFADESEFVNNTYAGTTVFNILDNTYNKSMYSAADYFTTVSNGKINMQTLYLFEDGKSLTLTRPRGYYAEKDDNNSYGYEIREESSRIYELQEY